MRVEWVIGDNFLRAAKGVWSVHLTFQLLPAATSRQSHLTLLSYLRKSASISPRRISGAAVGLCFASIRGAFSQESDRVRKNPREEPVADYMLRS
jgi:hypothetical protein